MSDQIPRAWRLMLAEVFADAEDHGLGTWTPTFQAAPGCADQAADFMEKRVDFLSSKLDGGEPGR